jgi:hypothetical protein
MGSTLALMQKGKCMQSFGWETNNWMRRRERDLTDSKVSFYEHSDD